MKSTLNLKAALAGAVSLGSLLLCTMSWAPMAFAADQSTVEVVKLDPKLKYKEVSETEQSAETNSFLANIIVKFASHDLYAIPMEGVQGPNVLTMSRADIAFANESLDHMVFIKTGVKLSDDKAVGKLLKMPKNVYGYHKVTKSGLPVAVIFTGFTEQEVVQVAGSVLVASNSPVLPSSFVAMILNSLVPSACAATRPEDCLSPTGFKGVKFNAESIKAITSKLATPEGAAMAGKTILDCATSAVMGALFATKAGSKVGLVMLAGGAGGLAFAGAKSLVTDWSGSVAKVGASVQKTSAVVSKLYADIKTETSKVSKSAWESLVAHPDVLADFACGIIGGLQKNAIVKVMDGAMEATGLSALVSNMAKNAKFAKFFPKKKGVETAIASETEVAVPSKTAKAAEEATPVAEVAAPVSFASNTELKSTLVQAGVKEPAPVLEVVSKAAKGGQIGSDDRLTFIQAMRSMKPEQQHAFEEKVANLLGKYESAAKSAAKGSKAGVTSHAAGAYSPKINLASVQHEFKHAERAVQVSSDPTLYPSLHKLSLVEKDEVAVADVIVAAEERGIPAPKINQAVEDAGAACKAK